MDNFGLIIGLWLVAVTIAVAAYVLTRGREGGQLRDQAELATELRRLADGDPVRLAAVDEFETTIYQRLFYAAVVGPRLRAAAWALLGAALTGTAALAMRDTDGVLATVLSLCLIVAAAVFLLGGLTYVGLAGYHAAATPRVSFGDSEIQAAPAASVAAAGADTAPASEARSGGDPVRDKVEATKS